MRAPSRVTAYLLDASAGADLLLDTVGGRSNLAQLQAGSSLVGSEHYFVEAASVVRRAERAGLITSAKALSMLRSLAAAPLHRVRIRPLLEEAWLKRGHLTVHDALYVVLAEHLNATLVTSYLRLTRSPHSVVAVITPQSPTPARCQTGERADGACYRWCLTPSVTLSRRLILSSRTLRGRYRGGGYRHHRCLPGQVRAGSRGHRPST